LACPIEAIETTTAGAIGVTERGPTQPVLVTSFTEFIGTFGGSSPEPARDRSDADPSAAGDWSRFPLYVKGFFDNGGQRLYVIRAVGPPGQAVDVSDFLAAIDLLNEVDDVALCLVPGICAAGVQGALVEQCARRRDRFALLDAPEGLDIPGALNFRRPRDTSFAALYYPWLCVAAPLGASSVSVAPSAYVAGILARVDRERGMRTGIAGEPIRGATGITRSLSDADSAQLAAEGINPLRALPRHGIVVWGARALSRDPEWKYVNVRRLFIFIEKSIDRGTQWVVFEPNGEALWACVRESVSDFLFRLWRAGELPGAKPDEAFFVRCDRTTMTQENLDQGRLVCLVGVAPLRPAEFVTFRIGQWTDDHKQ